MIFEIFFLYGYSSCRFGVKCSYAEAGIKEDFNSTTIDVAANVRTERVITYYLQFMFYIAPANHNICNLANC